MRKSAVVSLLVGFSFCLASVVWVVGAPASAPQAKRSYRPILPPANFSPPILEVDQADYDWGKTLQGEKVSHDYVFTNKGGSPLVISQVKASCGCTTAAKPKKPIPPGGSDVVTLQIDTKRFTGKVKKTARIYSNSAQSPLTISIGGVVETFYTMDPKTPRLNVVRNLPSEIAKVTLRRNANASVSFKILKVETPSKVLTANVAEVTPGEVYQVTLGAEVGENARKYFYEKVNLTMEVNGKAMEVPFNVSVSVKERIDVQPRTSVYFSRNDTKALKEPGAPPITKTLEIVSLGGPAHNFHITGVTAAAPVSRKTPAAAPSVPTESTPKYFETKIDTLEEGKRYRLTVVMNALPTEKVRTLRERLLLATDDPTVKALTITAMAAVY